jgi:hypothetical protein
VLENADAVWQFYRNQPGAGWGLTLVEQPAADVAALPAALAAQEGRGAVLGLEVGANIGLVYGWADYRDYDPMFDNRHKLWVRLMSRGTYHGATISYATGLNLLPPRPDMYSLIGLGWVAARDPQDPNIMPADEPYPMPPLPAGPVFVRAQSVAGFGIWRNRYARPFAYFAREVRVVDNGDVIWQFYRNTPGAGWGLTQVEQPAADVTALPAAQAPEAAPGPDPALLGVGAGQVAWTRPTPGELVLTVERPAGSAGLLVVNESWAAGWRATVDDQPVPLYRVNYLVQGVNGPGGAHTVRLAYAPPEVAWGLGLSVASVVLWLALLAALAFRAQKDQLSRSNHQPPTTNH